MNIYSAKQLYEADAITTKKQEITSVDLMERAATQIFNWLHQRMQGAQVPIHIFSGIGNNGGDGLALGRLLLQNGYNVTIYIANYTDKRSKSFLVNYDRVKNTTKKWPILMTCAADFPVIAPEDIIVDAIFGIGLNRAPEGWVKELIQYLNLQKAFKLSIDVPSGMSSESRILDPEAVIKAGHTLTFQSPKLSFFLPETGKFVPYFETLDIGLDLDFLMSIQPLARMVMKPQAQRFYKQREKFAHKGSFGHSLLIGGSVGKMGAMVLCTKAALKVGSGLASAYIPNAGLPIVQIAVPEAMVIPANNDTSIENISYDLKPSAIGMGPGLGLSAKTAAAVLNQIKSAKSPMVLDADALTILATHQKDIKKLPPNTILTPHLGELERLIGTWKDDFEKLENTKTYSKEHQVVVVIKGANTIVVQNDDLYINTNGNPGMATAGSGDVLTGMITGLLAQGYEPLFAALFGVYLHGSAGNIVAQEQGFEAVMAGDMVNEIGKAFLALFAQEPMPQQEESAQEQ